jgi:hypothetical protein
MSRGNEYKSWKLRIEEKKYDQNNDLDEDLNEEMQKSTCDLLNEHFFGKLKIILKKLIENSINASRFQ